MAYHNLTVQVSGQTYKSLILSAPRRAYAADSSRNRDWGCFLPLYALCSERNWGAGDFTDLRNLVEWTSRLGGTIVGTLPLLAAFLDEPCEPSPYAPASRLAWNDFYVHVASIPGIGQLCRGRRVAAIVRCCQPSEQPAAVGPGRLPWHHGREATSPGLRCRRHSFDRSRSSGTPRLSDSSNNILTWRITPSSAQLTSVVGNRGSVGRFRSATARSSEEDYDRRSQAVSPVRTMDRNVSTGIPDGRRRRRAVPGLAAGSLSVWIRRLPLARRLRV